MFCKHEWVLLTETVTESKFEVTMKQMKDGSQFKLPGQLCDADRKHIQVFTCNKCGEFKRFVEDI